MSQLFRVGGGWTVFAYQGAPFQYAQTVSDQAPQPVAPPQAIHPLGQKHPIEVAFPNATGMGTLTVTMWEQWDREVWQSLPGYENALTLLDVFAANIQAGNVTITKLITKPTGGTRSIYLHGAVITNVAEGEQISIETMTLPKQVTFQYTHRSGSPTS